MKTFITKFLLTLLLLAALALQGCGYKGPPVPPEDTPPAEHLRK